jgi:hypothetical protein
VVFGIGLALSIVVSAAPAPAALDMALGDRRTVANTPLSDCNTRAQAALTATLQRPDEIGEGTGEWRAYTKVEKPATPPEAASIHCFPVDNGYYVTFECFVEIPPSTTSAADLCTKIMGAFDAKQSARVGTSAAGGAR